MQKFSKTELKWIENCIAHEIDMYQEMEVEDELKWIQKMAVENLVSVKEKIRSCISCDNKWIEIKN